MNEKFFLDNHASYKDELEHRIGKIEDSDEVRDARGKDPLTLAKALTKQLRYTEAAEEFSKVLEKEPDNLEVLRLRAGKYLTTMQMDKSIADFERCLESGGDVLDINYRLGIIYYLLGDYEKACDHQEIAMKDAGDEMGIAIIYWHTLAAMRCNRELSLVKLYHEGMKVGHHTAYERAMQVISGNKDIETGLKELKEEDNDLNFSMFAYGLSEYLRNEGRVDEAEALVDEILRRDSFWISFAFIAAYNDRRK